MMLRSLTLLALIGVVFLSIGRAEADCASVSSCLCQQVATVFDATITGVAAGTTTFRVNATHGAQLDGGSPATLELRGFPADEAGQRYLVFHGQGRSRISSAEQVQCNNIAVPLAEAVEIALAEDCEARLAAKGIDELPCNDTFPCSCGSSAAGAGGFGVALLLVLGRTRRRRNR